MKTKLVLNSKLFNSAATTNELSKVVRRNTLELESEIKRSMADGTPRGRLYRRGRITRAASASLKRAGFRTFKTANGNRRAVVGAKFHRASAPGQVPAVDTGAYVNSIVSDFPGRLRGRVSTNKVQAQFLERTRPHFEPARRKQSKKLEADVKTVLDNLIK